MMGKIKDFLRKEKLRGQLMKCFKAGEIFIVHKGSEGKKYYKYPKIHEVHIDEEKEAVRFTFTLPNGLNPDMIHNHEWLFQQFFGKNIEIKGNKVKKFILWVYLNEAFESYKFKYEDIVKLAKSYSLPIPVGRDAQGRFKLFDMVENPHMLIMGETGSGKSVYLRSVLTFLSIYMRNRIEIYCADMKRTEFFLFKNLDNVVCTVTDKEALLFHLLSIKKELKHRGDLFDKAEVAHIDEYNALPKKKKLPYMLLCIDEVALLKKDKAHMDIIEEISCIGRALGCLMLLSMQRGDSKILDGNLKNNLTVRAVFRCADKINSDIGLGRGSEEDASQILKSEKGKFYFKMEETTLLQAPLLELESAKKILQPFRVKAKDKCVQDTPEKPLEDDIETLPVL